MTDQKRISYISLSRGIELGPTYARPLSQLLIKRKYLKSDLSSNSSQNKIEVITKANFIIRRHNPVANPFKDFPKHQPQLFVPMTRYPIAPKKVIHFCPRKTIPTKLKQVHRSLVKQVHQETFIPEEPISGWAGSSYNT